MCPMCLWCGYGMKLYPCSPEYVMGTPAAIAARCWACCCCWCCCCCCTTPSTGIWYPVGMLMFLSKKKFPNPVCDAGIFPAVPAPRVWMATQPPGSIYIQPAASVCARRGEEGWKGGRGRRGGGSTGIDWQLRSKDLQLSLGNKSHQRRPPLFLLAFSWRG